MRALQRLSLPFFVLALAGAWPAAAGAQDLPPAPAPAVTPAVTPAVMAGEPAPPANPPASTTRPKGRFGLSHLRPDGFASPK